MVEGATYHTVISGDTMYKIAVKHDMTLNALVALNPQVKNINLIYVGQKLMIHAGTGTAAPAAPAVPVAPATPSVLKVYQGVGYKTTFRVGPGKDDTGTQVYSFNIAMASATFDSAGRIINVFIDGYEVSTPNYDGASMPHFSGWPGQSGYNVADHESGKITGVSANTEATAAAEVSTWLTKRQRGDSYHMNAANEWYKQMDFFQEFFKGKTVMELEKWFMKNTTAAGRPIKASTTNAADLAKLAALSEAEKAELADVVAGATMSVRDSHGDFLGAVVEAYLNRIEVSMPVK
jgi:LysM repeat protein